MDPEEARGKKRAVRPLVQATREGSPLPASISPAVRGLAKCTPRGVVGSWGHGGGGTVCVKVS